MAALAQPAPSSTGGGTWNESASVYAGVADQIAFYRECALRLLSVRSGWRGCRVVDLACGSNVIVARLLATLPDPPVSILCADSSPEMVRLARMRHPKLPVEFAVCPAEQIHTVVSGAHAVLCNCAIWNFDLARALPSIHTALLPGGSFAFTISEWDIETEPSVEHPKYLLIGEELKRRGLPPKPSRGSKNKLTFDGFAESLRGRHFVDVEIEPFELPVSAKEYGRMYCIPSIARRSLPHIPLQEAMELLALVCRRLDGCSLPPVRWFRFHAKRG